MPKEKANEETWMKKKEDQGLPPPPVSEATPGPLARPDPRERRKHERFSVEDCRLTLYRDGLMSAIGLRKENIGRELLDLSEGGARVRTTDRVKIGTRVRMKIEIAKYADHVEASGEVRWSAQHPKRQTEFTAGIMFVKLDPVYARKLINMKNWFTSPQYRLKRETAQRNNPNDMLKKLKLD